MGRHDDSGAGVSPMSRHIRFSEPLSGLDARCVLLDEQTPATAELLWDIAGLNRAHAAIHAMWTGPEISVPISANAVLPGRDVGQILLENATSYPQAGEIALVCARRNTWMGAPPFDLMDVGLFYDKGGRLLMPMGWIMGNICARIVDEDLAATADACCAIRRNGACQVHLSRCT
jgi:hypothetical protein